MAGTAVGFVNTGGNLGGFLAALLTPWFVQEIGWIGAFDIASLLAIAGAISKAGMRRGPWFYGLARVEEVKEDRG